MEESSTRLHKKAKRPMEESESITRETDICEQILNRYGKFIAPQNGYEIFNPPLYDLLCETAGAIHTKIEAESLPLTPLSYFVAVIDGFKRCNNDVDVLSAILAIVLPQVSEKAKVMSMAVEAVEILGRGALQLSILSETTFRVIECLGQLLLDVCDSKDWVSLRLGFDTLLQFSLNTYPKVRRKFAQDCVVKLFKAFKSCDNKTSATKWVSASLIAGFSRITDDEVLGPDMLELIKLLLPCFPSDLIYEGFFLTIYSSLRTSSKTMYLLDVSEAILGFLESESEDFEIIYRFSIQDKWKKEHYSVAAKIAELLDSREEETTSARASGILLGVFERVRFLSDAQISNMEEFYGSEESESLCLLCNALLKVLSSSTFPNKHLLAVIGRLFYKLGPHTDFYMRKILLKLADFMSQTFVDDTLDAKHLRGCIGYGVIAMHENKLPEVIPIKLDTNNHSCLNPWIISLLKDYVFASSLGFFFETIVPLAKSVEEARQKVDENESVIREQIESLARDLWGLLPAFSRWPRDLEESFGHLATLVIPYIQKDALMLESVAIALQYLVKQNKDLSFLTDDEASKLPWTDWYYEEFASANIEVMSSWSEELLEAFSKVFFQVSPDKRAVIKETIECLSLITEPSTVKEILFSHCKKMMSIANISLVLELAPSSVGAASIDFTDILYSCIIEWLQEGDEKSTGEAYDAFHKILNEYPEFMSSKFDQLVDLLLGLKSPDDIDSLRCRFFCFKILIVHSIKITCGGENEYGDRMLTEIFKDFKEEHMDLARAIILEIGSILKESVTV